MIMLEKVEQILWNKCQIDRKSTVVTAVSGGPDSLCLLDILCRLDLNLIVAHFDHSLRPDSRDEIQMVQEFARRKNVNFIQGVEDVKTYASLTKQSIEEAGRSAR